MNRMEAMRVVADARGDAAVVTGPGVNAGFLFEWADAPATLYNMDMGYAAPIALGIALAKPGRRVLALEGEGSFFAGSTVLATIWRLRPRNLSVVVLDNGVWGTGDGLEPTATAFGLDLAALARANGWEAAHVHQARDPDALGRALATALAGAGPHFVVGKTDPRDDTSSASSAMRPRPKRHILDCAVLMRHELARDG